MPAKLIHHKLREKTKNMSLQEKVKYLGEHKKKKEASHAKIREKRIADFRAQPVVKAEKKVTKRKSK